MNIELRPLRATDAEAFMRWGGDPAVTASLFWDHYTDVESARTFLKNVAEIHPWFMAILLDGSPVGAITLDRGQGRGAHRAELGYVVSKAHWGRGVASRAAELALECGFNDLAVSRIEAYVDPDNIASIKVLEKAGMKQEGLLQKYVTHRGRIRDRLIYAKAI